MKKRISLSIIIIILVFFATIALGIFMAYDRTLKSKFDQEIFLLLVRFLLTIILTGLGILGYRVFTIERDIRNARREDLQVIYDQVTEMYHRLMQTLHVLRASVGFEPDGESYKWAKINPEVYQTSMKIVLEAQQGFRSNATRARDYQLGYSRSNLLADRLVAIDTTLTPLIEEYEAEWVTISNPDRTTAVQDLPELLEFITLASSNHPLSEQSRRAFDAALASLNKTRYEWDARA